MDSHREEGINSLQVDLLAFSSGISRCKEKWIEFRSCIHLCRITSIVLPRPFLLLQRERKGPPYFPPAGIRTTPFHKGAPASSLWTRDAGERHENGSHSLPFRPATKSRKKRMRAVVSYLEAQSATRLTTKQIRNNGKLSYRLQEEDTHLRIAHLLQLVHGLVIVDALDGLVDDAMAHR